MPFAFSPAKADEDGYFALHRKKAPAMLGKDAKSEGEGAKFAFGMAGLEGKILSLTCEREIPALAKKMKRYLKSQKVILNVQVLDASGNVIDSDIEENLPDDPNLLDDETSQQDGASDVQEEDLARESHAGVVRELTARLAKVKGEIAVLPDAAAQKIKPAYAAVVAQLKSGDVQGATVGTEMIEAVIARLSGTAREDPAKVPGDQGAKILTALKTLKAQAEDLAESADRAAINQRIARAADMLRNSDLKSATAAVVRIGDDLRARIAATKKLQPGIGLETEPLDPQGVPRASFEALVGDDETTMDGNSQSPSATPLTGSAQGTLTSTANGTSTTNKAFAELDAGGKAERLKALGLPQALAAEISINPERAARAAETLAKTREGGVPAESAAGFLRLAEKSPEALDSALGALKKLDPDGSVDGSPAGNRKVMGDIADARLVTRAPVKISAELKGMEERLPVLREDQANKDSDFIAKKASFDAKAAHHAGTKVELDRLQELATRKTNDAKALKSEHARIKAAYDQAVTDGTKSLEVVAAFRKAVMDAEVALRAAETDAVQATNAYNLQRPIEHQAKAARDAAAIAAEAAKLAFEAAKNKTKLGKDAISRTQQKLADAETAKAAAEAKLVELGKQQENIATKRALLAVISHGPLADGTTPAIDATQAKQLLDVYVKDPGLGAVALEVLGKGGDVAAILKNAGKVADKRRTGSRTRAAMPAGTLQPVADNWTDAEWQRIET